MTSTPVPARRFVALLIVLACLFVLMGLVNERVTALQAQTDALRQRVSALEASKTYNTE